MSGQTILITGTTGHVGFAVLVLALSKGYKVRAAVRSEAKAEPIKAARSIQPYLSALSFIVVPDIAKPGAFDEVVKGVNGIIHVASPIPDIADLANAPREGYDLATPAVQGTTSILKSALKEPSIKRVVITSSTAALADFTQDMFARDMTPETQGVAPPEPYDSALTAYVASKILAHQASQKFITEQKPHFSIVSIMPSYVIGKNELATTPKAINSGSNHMILAALLGEKKQYETFTAVIHLDDVARAHVESLDTEKVKGNESFILSYDWTADFKWDDAIPIAKKDFPEAVKKGILPSNGNTPTTPPLKLDASKAEKVFGKFQPPEAMVKNLVSYYVEVAST